MLNNSCIQHKPEKKIKGLFQICRIRRQISYENKDLQCSTDKEMENNVTSTVVNLSELLLDSEKEKVTA